MQLPERSSVQCFMSVNEYNLVNTYIFDNLRALDCLSIIGCTNEIRCIRDTITLKCFKPDLYIVNILLHSTRRNCQTVPKSGKNILTSLLRMLICLRRGPEDADVASICSLRMIICHNGP